MPTRTQVNTKIATNLADASDITAAELRDVQTTVADYVDQQDALKADKVSNKSLVLDTEITKLATVQANATANDTDANLKARANHTGVQAISTVTGLQTALDGKQPAGSYAAFVHTHLLSDITNVVISSPSSGQVLKFNGTNWVNGTDNVGGGSGGGDMFASTFDANGNGVVDDAEKLNSQAGSYYLNTDNHTNGTTNKVYTATEKTKLASISASATANSTDATLLNRANHTGTQTASTVSDFQTAVSSNTDVTANTAARHSAETGASIKNKLETLTGTNRLDASAIKNLTAGGATSNVFQAADYGVLGDGTTDNTTFINNAIAACSTAGGGIVELAKGTFIVKAAYVTTDSYQPKGIIMASNVILRGQGVDVTVIKLSAPPAGTTYSSTGSGGTLAVTTNSAFYDIIKGNGVTNAAVENLTIDGNFAQQKNWTSSTYNAPSYNAPSPNLSTYGIFFINGSHNRITNVKVRDVVGIGACFYSSDYAIIEKSYGFGNGIGFINVNDSKYSIVQGNICNDNYADGIIIGYGSDGTIVNGNTCNAAKFNALAGSANYAGIYLEGAAAVKVINNTCIGNSSFGIDVWDNALSTARNIVIDGNYVTYNSNGGIRFGYSYSKISNNIIVNNGANASNVQDPVIYHPFGIDMSTASHNTLSNNKFYDDRGYQTHAIGFDNVSNNGKNIYRGNDLVGGTNFFNATVSTTDNYLDGNTWETGGALSVVTGSSSGGSSATSIFSDDFTGANVTDIAGRTTITGSKTWALGDGNGTIGIVSNKAKLTSSAATYGRYYVDAGLKNIDLRATIGNATTSLNLVLNYTNSGTLIGVNMINGAIDQYIAGTGTSLYAGSSTNSITGDVIRVVRNEASLSLYRNGTLLTTVTVDNATLTATKHGFIIYQDISSSLDAIEGWTL